jgi:hypothetical protein
MCATLTYRAVSEVANCALNDGISATWGEYCPLHSSVEVGTWYWTRADNYIVLYVDLRVTN